MKRFYRRLIGAMLLGVLLYGLIVVYTGYGKIHESVATFAWSTFAWALALATANYGLRFLKWEYYLRRLGIRGIPKLDSLLIFLSGFVLTVTPGKVGEVFKSAVLAATYRVPAARTAPIVVAERMTDVIGVVALIAIGSAGFSGGLPWAAAGSVLVLAALVLVLWPKPGQALIGWLERGPQKLQPLAPKLAESFTSLRVVASPSALLIPSAISVMSWGCEGIALFVLLRGFAAPVTASLAVFFYATATLAGAIIPVPGGLGVTEVMMREQLVQLGHVDSGASTAAMILVRFATLWWAVLVGFAALGVLRTRHRTLFADAAVLGNSVPEEPVRRDSEPAHVEMQHDGAERQARHDG